MILMFMFQVSLCGDETCDEKQVDIEVKNFNFKYSYSL